MGPDPEFQAKVTSIDTTLRDASDGLESPSTITNAISTASSALAAALSALEKSRADAALEQEQLGRLLSARYALPAQLQAARLSAKPGFDEAQKEIERERFSVALVKQGEARETLVGEAASAGREWAGQVNKALTALETASAPAEVRTALETAITRTRSALSGVTAIDPAEPDKANINAVLRAAEDALAHFTDVKLIVGEVDRTVVDVRDALSPTADLGAVDDANARLNDVLADDSRTSDLGTAYADLLDALAEAIRAASGDSNSLDELLAAGRYADAAREAAAIATGETSLSANGTGAAPAPFLIRRVPALEREGVITDIRPVPGLAAVFANPVVVQLLGRTQQTVGRLIQWALLAIVFLVLTWALFYDTFVGTNSDMAKVFLWAFALDLSGNTLVDSAKGLRGA